LNLHFEFLVEEFSAEEFLKQILPKIIRENNVDFKIHSFRGKQDLLKKLPKRLKGYKAWIPEYYRIVILLDQDEEDCERLKNKLEKMAGEADFITKSKANSGEKFQVLNKIAIEELEAWFFGDIEAIRVAYPKVSKNLENQKPYRNPDAIQGGTWEALEKILKSAGYHQGGLEKVKAAKEISQYMNPGKNNSKSFQVFYQGLLKLISHC
jgi:hypothetical protein